MSSHPPSHATARHGRFFFCDDPKHADYLPLRHRMLLEKLAPFYKNDRLLTRVIGRHVKRNDTPSLRVIDWFCTNYAKKYQTMWVVKRGGRERFVQIHVDYKMALQTYRRGLFDPFQRFVRIYYKCPEVGTFKTTTVAQLNFFRWASDNGLLLTLRDQRVRREIERDMNCRKIHPKGKRIALSAAPETIVVVRKPTTIHF